MAPKPELPVPASSAAAPRELEPEEAPDAKQLDAASVAAYRTLGLQDRHAGSRYTPGSEPGVVSKLAIAAPQLGLQTLPGGHLILGQVPGGPGGLGVAAHPVAPFVRTSMPFGSAPTTAVGVPPIAMRRGLAALTPAMAPSVLPGVPPLIPSRMGLEPQLHPVSVQQMQRMLEEQKKQEEKKRLKRAANRRSACSSRARKKQYVEEITLANQLLRKHAHILDLLPDMVIGVGPDDIISYASKSCSRMLHYPQAALVGANILDLITPQTRSILNEALSRVQRSHTRGVGDHDATVVGKAHGSGKRGGAGRGSSGGSGGRSSTSQSSTATGRGEASARGSGGGSGGGGGGSSTSDSSTRSTSLFRGPRIEKDDEEEETETGPSHHVSGYNLEDGLDGSGPSEGSSVNGHSSKGSSSSASGTSGSNAATKDSASGAFNAKNGTPRGDADGEGDSMLTGSGTGGPEIPLDPSVPSTESIASSTANRAVASSSSAHSPSGDSPGDLDVELSATPLHRELDSATAGSHVVAVENGSMSGSASGMGAIAKSESQGSSSDEGRTSNDSKSAEGSETPLHRTFPQQIHVGAATDAAAADSASAPSNPSSSERGTKSRGKPKAGALADGGPSTGSQPSLSTRPSSASRAPSAPASVASSGSQPMSSSFGDSNQSISEDLERMSSESSEEGRTSDEMEGVREDGFATWSRLNLQRHDQQMHDEDMLLVFTVCVVRQDRSTVWCEVNSNTRASTEDGPSSRVAQETILSFRPISEGEKVGPEIGLPALSPEELAAREASLAHHLANGGDTLPEPRQQSNGRGKRRASPESSGSAKVSRSKSQNGPKMSSHVSAAGDGGSSGHTSVYSSSFSSVSSSSIASSAKQQDRSESSSSAVAAHLKELPSAKRSRRHPSVQSQGHQQTGLQSELSVAESLLRLMRKGGGDGNS